MDKDYEAFKNFVETQIIEFGSVPDFVGDWAESFINEDNVNFILEYLATLPGSASLTFWERINSAPFTEAEWNKLFFVAAEMDPTEGHQEKLRAKYKKVVTIVRNSKYYQKNMVELFRGRNA